MQTSITEFSDEEKRAIIHTATKENGDFDYCTFLRLVAEEKEKKRMHAKYLVTIRRPIRKIVLKRNQAS